MSTSGDGEGEGEGRGNAVGDRGAGGTHINAGVLAAAAPRARASTQGSRPPIAAKPARHATVGTRPLPTATPSSADCPTSSKPLTRPKPKPKPKPSLMQKSKSVLSPSPVEEQPPAPHALPPLAMQDELRASAGTSTGPTPALQPPPPPRLPLALRPLVLQRQPVSLAATMDLGASEDGEGGKGSEAAGLADARTTTGRDGLLNAIHQGITLRQAPPHAVATAVGRDGLLNDIHQGVALRRAPTRAAAASGPALDWQSELHLRIGRKTRERRLRAAAAAEDLGAGAVADIRGVADNLRLIGLHVC